MNKNGAIPVQDAAKILGVTRMTVYNWLRHGQMADTSPASIQARADEIAGSADEIRARLARYQNERIPAGDEPVT